MRYVVDGNRAGEVLAPFVKRWAYQLASDIRGVVLDFRANKTADELCRRIAADPDLDLRVTDRTARALVSARINLFLSKTIEEPEAEVFSKASPMTEREILAHIFERFLSKVRLPRDWNGKPFG